MEKRKVRNLATTTITILSALVLTALGATGASAATRAPAAASASAVPASTNPTCYSDGPYIPWTCVQVFGNGNDISSMNGWADDISTSIYSGESVHIELYYATSNRAPGSGVTVIHGNSGYCGEEDLPYDNNTPNCTWIPTGTDNPVNTGYYCSALWWYEDLPGNVWTLLGWRCVYVH